MSEDYQHACERADLLGVPRPSEEEWRQSLAAQNENRDGDDVDNDALQGLEQSDETAGRIGGGLDGLNTILKTTQKKLNRFKTVCGRMGTLLKVKVNSRGGTPRHKPEEPNPDAEKRESQEKPESDEVMTVETSGDPLTDPDAANQPANSGVQPKQISLSKKMESNLNKLGSLITKVENTQYTMTHQPANSGDQSKQVELDKKMGSNLDKLESLIVKAENAQYTMQHQNKQMKKFLKK